MFWVTLIFVLVTLTVAIFLTIVQKIFAVKEDPIVEKIDKLLPQTQCGQCGYPGCMPYAQAVANGEEINKCVPGGQELVVKLSELLNRPVPDGELEEPIAQIAIIDEVKCIGCLHCIEACPVDAIIGSKKLMHVIIPDYCTGCELCVDPCPQKCISMIPRPVEVDKFSALRKQINLPKSVTPTTLIKVVNAPALTNTNIVSNNSTAFNPIINSTNNSTIIKQIATAVQHSASTNNSNNQLKQLDPNLNSTSNTVYFKEKPSLTNQSIASSNTTITAPSKNLSLPSSTIADTCSTNQDNLSNNINNLEDSITKSFKDIQHSFEAPKLENYKETGLTEAQKAKLIKIANRKTQNKKSSGSFASKRSMPKDMQERLASATYTQAQHLDTCSTVTTKYQDINLTANLNSTSQELINLTTTSIEVESNQSHTNIFINNNLTLTNSRLDNTSNSNLAILSTVANLNNLTQDSDISTTKSYFNLNRLKANSSIPNDIDTTYASNYQYSSQIVARLAQKLQQAQQSNSLNTSNSKISKTRSTTK